MNHIELALNMAHKSESRFRLGAVLAKRNKVISTGYNQMRKTHPLQEKYNKGEHTIGLHAEVHACLSVDIADLNGAELFVARVLKNGNQAMAKPCETCVRFMRDVGIRTVTYTTDNVSVYTWEL
jgi:deoxycytidylate deaminase